MDYKTPIADALEELAAIARNTAPIDGTAIEAIADRVRDGDALAAAAHLVIAEEEKARYEVQWTDRTASARGRLRTTTRDGSYYRSLIRGILDNPDYTLILARRLKATPGTASEVSPDET
jgi:hypothetical protein